MFELIKKALGHEYFPLNSITISRKALLSNYKLLSAIEPNIKIAPVVKSNAYGHGIKQVGKIFDGLNCPMICVDSIFEAYELLKAGVKTQILIMGFVDGANLKVKMLPFAYAVDRLDQLKDINQYQKGADVHIKIDTGMHREGVPMSDAREFLTKVKKFKNVNVVGIMSHLAYSESKSSKLTQGQVKNFKKAVDLAKALGFEFKWIHLAASGGLLSLHKELAGCTNLARVGLVLYGVEPVRPVRGLLPALKLTTHLTQVKRLAAGEQVGYGGTYVAKSDMKIGELPIGYYDGVDRRLSNKGCVTIRNIACPIIGRASMNITTIDVSSVKTPKVGQEVVIFSDKLSDPNTVEKCAKICGTISYDLLVHLPESTRRVIV